MSVGGVCIVNDGYRYVGIQLFLTHNSRYDNLALQTMQIKVNLKGNIKYLIPSKCY